MKKSALKNILLVPAASAYGMATWCRNKMFDMGLMRQHEFDVATVSVGNLAVGGTGKTPHTEHIVSFLCRKMRVGGLSRGYKRHTKGFVLATPQSTPADIGDESYQVYTKFRDRGVMVAVCEDRVAGIGRMMEIDPNLDVIVLDDAFQHRHVKPRVSIVLTEFDRPVFRDHLQPYGRLRESRHGISRADIVIATKCPDGIKPLDFTLFQENLGLIPAQSLFFSRFAYRPLRPVFPDQAKKVPVMEALTAAARLLCVCGIANPRPFVRYVKSFAPKVKVNVFPDHHAFSRRDMDLLQQRYKSLTGANNFIITTEKDAVRLAASPYFPHELKARTFYVPVEVEFVNRDPGRPMQTSQTSSSASFDETLLRLIRSKCIIR